MLIISTWISKAHSGFRIINELSNSQLFAMNIKFVPCLSLYIIVSSVTQFYVNNIHSSSDWSLETPILLIKQQQKSDNF